MFGSNEPKVSTPPTETSSTKSTTKSTSEVIYKRHLSEEVASTHDLSMAQSERIVNTIFDTIVEGVVDGKQVRLTNFGVFESYISKATVRANPRTGKALNVPAKRRIRFKAYTAFKKA
eukprot:jgi/Psemu1/203805/e_gw1.333.16.1